MVIGLMAVGVLPSASRGEAMAEAVPCATALACLLIAMGTMSDKPPLGPLANPPPPGQLPVEPALPDTEDGRHLYLAAEAVRQQAKSLTEELTQAVEAIIGDEPKP